LTARLRQRITELASAAREVSRLVNRALTGGASPSIADAARATLNAAKQEASGLPNCTGV